MTLALLLLAVVALIPVNARAMDRWPVIDGNGDPDGSDPGGGPDPGGDARRRTTATGGGSRVDALLERMPAGLRRLTGSRAHAPTPMELLDAAAALDLLAACMSSGMPPGDAVSATASAAPTRLARPLSDVAGRLSLGASAPWAALADVPELADVATVARRSGDSGAAMAAAVAELAAARRAAAGDAAEATAERAGVLIAGPLALCFLPAFVVLGLLPTIAGLAESMLGPLVAGSA